MSRVGTYIAAKLLWARGVPVAPAAYVTRTVTPTTTGNFDITDSRLNGATPKGAVIIGNYATTDGTAINDANFCYGVSDGTNGWVVSVNSEHGQTTTDTHRQVSTSDSFILNDAGTATSEIEGGIATMIEDGIRINFSAVDASNQRFITAILFVGDNFEAKAGTKDLGTGTDAITVSGVGFEPEVLITGFGELSIDADGAGAVAGLGFVHNGASVTERSFAWVDKDAVETTELVAHISDDSCIHYTNSSGTDVGELVTSNYGADGFDVTPSASFVNHDLLFFALTTGGEKSWKVGTYSTPTSTGSDATTGVGFQPQFVLMGNTILPTVNTTATDGNAGSVGVSAWDDTNQFSNSISSEDGATTSNTQSLSDNIALHVPSHKGNLQVTGTLTSFDSDGWTLNITEDLGATARQQWFLALEA